MKHEILEAFGNLYVEGIGIFEGRAYYHKGKLYQDVRDAFVNLDHATYTNNCLNLYFKEFANIFNSLDIAFYVKKDAVKSISAETVFDEDGNSRSCTKVVVDCTKLQ